MSVIGNHSWKCHDDTIIAKKVWQTDRSVLRAAWSQLKTNKDIIKLSVHMYHGIMTIRKTRIHDVICDVTRSQSWSTFKIIIFPSIFQLECQTKFEISEMLMAILWAYSTSGISSGEKFVATSKWQPFWNNERSFHLISDMWWSSRIMHKNFMVMTSSMTSQSYLKLSSIFMFRRGWLRKQVARAML